MDQNPIACIIRFGTFNFQQIYFQQIYVIGGTCLQRAETGAYNVLESIVAHRVLRRLVADASAQHFKQEQEEIPMSENGPKPPAETGLSPYDLRMLTQLPRRKGNPPTAEQIRAARLRSEGKSSVANDPRKLRPKPQVDRADLTRKYTASLKARDIETLSRIAEKERRPLSTLVRHIVEDWIADHEARHAARGGEGEGK